MIRRNYTHSTPAEEAAGMPDPKRLVSFGEQTQFATVLTNGGAKEVPVTFEVFYEYRHGGFGEKCWLRFKDRPDELVPQFDTSIRDKPLPTEEYTPEEKAAMRAMLPAKEPPVPEPPPRPLFDRPNW